MKKIIALIMVAALVLCFAGCGNSNTSSESSKSDLDYVKEKGTLVVGITDFEPMDYKNDSGEWIGFDADMAKLFGEKLGVKVSFTEIDWDNKVLELDGKTIDCVWNGMTLTDEVKNSMETTKPYCNNAQVVVVKKDVADKYQKAEDCKDLKFAVESGSAGQDMAEENKFQFTAVKDQASALLEVKSGTCDAAIIDSLMAAAMVGEGTDYAELTYTASLNSEEYGVGFRKGSGLAEEFNKFLEECKTNGKLDEVANTYKVQAALIK